jgi:hypothetical protein
MVVPETIEGLVNGSLWFHYDVDSDVLYVRLAAERDTPAVGEETTDGLILLRSESTDRPLGLTIVGWWKRFGRGTLPDSLQAIGTHVEPLARRIAA